MIQLDGCGNEDESLLQPPEGGSLLMNKNITLTNWWIPNKTEPITKLSGLGQLVSGTVILRGICQE